MTAAPFHPDASSALLPVALPYFEDLTERGLVHRYALHHRSSQAFALNLFAPLDAEGLAELFRAVGIDATPSGSIEFEYSDPSDRLAEARPESSHRTQVDVVVRGTSPSGNRVVALVEVKFTEVDFGWCSAYENFANPFRDVCRSAGLFGRQPDRCFQLSNHGVGRRRYDQLLRDVPVVEPSGCGEDGGCIVRKSMNQPMRNLALAHLLLEGGEADRVAYALCAPAAHPTIWRRFAEFRTAFPDTETRRCAALTAEDVAALHPDGGAAVKERYPIATLSWHANNGTTTPD